MPITVRCKECSTILTLSDKARGRAVKCRECGARVQVGTGQPRSKQRPKRRPQRDPNPDNMFGGIDLASAEDAHRRICPSCARLVTEDEEECPYCGVNVETGVLSEKQRRRRARKAPPAEEFYGAVWSDGWKFLLKNRSWAVRTGLVWSITFTMAVLSAFTWSWYIEGREIELRESADGNITVTDDSVFIDLREGEKDFAMYDGKRYTRNSVGSDNTLTLPGPRQGAMRSPPAYFWSGMLGVSILGFGGWAWTLAVEIIKVTLAGIRKIKRFHTDLFGSMAMGFRSIFWPLILLAPFIWVPFALYHFTGNMMNVAISIGCLLLIPLFTFLPPALIHMSQDYTYRGWLINWMTRDLLKTFVPATYVSAMLLFLVLLLPLTTAALAYVYWNGITTFYANQVETRILELMDIGYDPAEPNGGFAFTFYRLPLLGTITFILSFIVWGLLAFPAIFMMRVYGLYGRYFRPDLALINEQVELEPAGFGPRFLAFLIDSLLLIVMAGVAWFLSIYTTKLFGFLYNFSEDATGTLYLALGCGSMLVLWAIYFSTWESGQNRGTLGKAAVGLVVLNDEDRPIDGNKAFARYLSGLVTAVTGFIGFAACAFTPKHKALHDMMTKTEVVWRGEGESA